MNIMTIYNKVIKEIAKIETKEEQFDTMFILTTMLIYNLSSQGKNLNTILQLLKEFDYEKNLTGGK